jgi:dolichol-phosphate mannosyltransferase
MRSDRVLVVLPTYNEAPNILPVTRAIRLAVPEALVLIVDDESTDGTAQLADELARADRLIEVIHRRGRGYGEALSAGFRVALERGATAVATLDGDLSHDPADLPRLLVALEVADLAIGSRYVPGGCIRGWGLERRVLSAAANAFVRLLLGLPTRDCTSGFRAYRREALDEVRLERLHSTGYSYLVEMLYWVGRTRSGDRIQEVPICFVDRQAGRSKMRFREMTMGALRLLQLRVRLTLRAD